MTPHSSYLPLSGSPPFVLELRTEAVEGDTLSTPSVAILLSPALRNSELWERLGAQEWHTLLLVLSCVTPNGTFIATAELLASRLHVWPTQMRSRLLKLARHQWNGEPLLRTQTTESGLRLFSPSPHLFEVRRVEVRYCEVRSSQRSENEHSFPQGQDFRKVGGLREAGIAHTRATYSRPRAEVEADIERFLRSGHMESGRLEEDQEIDALGVDLREVDPLEAAQRDLRRRLLSVGLTQEQAHSLLHCYPAERIEAQLFYLPYRRARHPAGMLIASIEGDYEAPVGLRPRPIADGSSFFSDMHDGAIPDVFASGEPKIDVDSNGADRNDADEQGWEGHDHRRGSALYSEAVPAFETDQAVTGTDEAFSSEGGNFHPVSLALPPDSETGKEVQGSDGKSSEAPYHEI